MSDKIPVIKNDPEDACSERKIQSGEYLPHMEQAKRDEISMSENYTNEKGVILYECGNTLHQISTEIGEDSDAILTELEKQELEEYKNDLISKLDAQSSHSGTTGYVHGVILKLEYGDIGTYIEERLKEFMEFMEANLEREENDYRLDVFRNHVRSENDIYNTIAKAEKIIKFDSSRFDQYGETLIGLINKMDISEFEKLVDYILDSTWDDIVILEDIDDLPENGVSMDDALVPIDEIIIIGD